MSYGGSILGGLLGLILLLCPADAFAEDGAKTQAPPPASADATSHVGETLKERLSDKASDDQRVDNCNVPLDRRGPKIRPDACSHDAARAAENRAP